MKKNIFEKFAKAVANMHGDERGMTGLETAIILIAFVTVAAVFGYAVLSAGLFSAERGKETIYAGLQQAKANMEVSGSVIVLASNATIPQVTKIKMTVRNAIAGSPIDMTPPGSTDAGATLTGTNNRCVISLTTANAYYNNIEWTMAYIGHNNANNLLDPGEQMELTVNMLGLGGTVTHFADPALKANDWFNIQVKPTQGSTMTIQRTLPAGLDPIMDMH